MGPQPPADLRKLCARAAARIARSGVRWKLPQDQIAEALCASVASWGGAKRGESAAQYLDSIRADELALAIACRAGIPEAWNEFIPRYRPALYGAARAITGEEAAAREIADSLWGELYGTEIRGGKRRSLLEYFHGRSSLATWLRAIVAQRHVDAARASRRFEPIEKAPEPASAEDPPDPEQPRLMEIFAAVLDAALAALAGRERMRLAYYYRDELTLREIARLMDEHESTVSRKLERTRRELRKHVQHALTARYRMSEEQIRLCYERAGEEADLDLAALSASPEPGSAQRKAGRPF